MNNVIKNIVVAMVMALVSFEVNAVPVIGDVWGSTLASPNPVWQVTDGPGNFGNAGVSWASPSVTLTLPNGFWPSARIYATDPHYAGPGVNYAALGTDLILKFNFAYTADKPPVGLQFYFMSGAGDMWVATGLDYTGATSYSVNIGSAGEWQKNILYNATPSMTWDSAFANVTQIGFEVFGDNTGSSQTYTFSDIQLTVPEPETVWMILMVLASLALTFRGRLGEAVDQLKVRIKA